MKKKLLGVVFFALAVGCAVSAVKEGGRDTLLAGVVLFLVFALLGARNLGFFPKKKKRAKQAAPIQPTAPAPAPPPVRYQFVNFKVSGVTFDNDDGTNRQTILANIENQQPPFEDADNLNVYIRRTTFRGMLAFDVWVNGIQIGWVPKEMLEDVDEAMRHSDVQVSGFRITGGMEGYNYGVDIALRYRSQ